MREKVVTKRDSGIELLRVLMMLQVVFLHVAAYGKYYSNVLILGGKHELLYWVVWLMCRCPVYMFIVVMGYFMSDNQKKGGGRFLKMYLPMYFYSLLMPIIAYFSGLVEVDKYDIYRAFLPATAKMWYFMTLYLILLLLMPYMNKLIQAMDRKEFLKLLGIFFLIFSIWQPLAKIAPLNKVFYIVHVISTEGGKSLYDFIFMYMLGAFLKRYRFIEPKNEQAKVNNWIHLLAFIGLGLINVVLVYAFPDIRSVIAYNDNPICVIQCVFLLRFFSNVHFYSKTINAIGACNLGIYMIHEHPLGRDLIWNHLVNMKSIDFYAKHTYVFKIVGVVLAVYFGCMLIELIRQQLFKIPSLVKRLKKQEGES